MSDLSAVCGGLCEHEQQGLPHGCITSQTENRQM
jgi:hypothetical protein